MGNVNKVILVGFVGDDPRVTDLKSGSQVANISLATSERWTDKVGEKQERTEWHRLVAWGKTAELFDQYVKKGSQIYVEGRLETREWTDKEGNKRFTTETVVNNLVFLDRLGAEAASGRQQQLPPAPADSEEI